MEKTKMEKTKTEKTKMEKTKTEKQVKQCLSKCYSEDLNIVEIGIDEVGRGPLVGRVYVGAVILPKETTTHFDFSLMKDSKKFTSKKKIEEVAEYIKQNATAWSVQYEDEKVVDEMNILQATQQCMHKCIKELIKSNHLDIQNTLLLVDGNYFRAFTTFTDCKIKQVEHKCITGGDNVYASIAAASILAKVARDNYIKELCISHPELVDRYNIHTNMGYGTAKHMAGIKEFGISEFHRKTFCKKVLSYTDDSDI